MIALATRAVEALDDDDITAIIQQDRLAILGAKAAPAGEWRDRRDPAAAVTIGDVVRATLARIIQSRLWTRIQERGTEFQQSAHT